MLDKIRKVLGILCLLLILAIIVYAVVSYFGWFTSKPPTIAQAPFTLTTESRVYFMQKYTETPEAVTITNFWTQDGDTWRYYKRDLIFVRKGYLTLKVERR